MVNGKEETIDSDLDDEDDANESRSSDATVTAKEVLYLLDKVQLFAAYNDEQGSLQKAVADNISMVEDFSIHSKKQSSITDFFKKKQICNFHTSYSLFLCPVLLKRLNNALD